MNNGSTTWTHCGLAALGYLGLLPLYFLLSRTRTAPFLDHHFRQSVAIYGLLLLITGVSAIAVAALSYLLVFHREFYETLHMEGYILGALRKLYVAWAVFWAFGLAMALLGGMRQMPLVNRLARKKRWVKGTCLCLLALYGFLLALVPVTVHACRLVPQDREIGAVYMVYEDNGVFPRWLFALAFYPMARTTEATFGPGQAVLQRISRESIAQALAHGRLVFIGSHGTRKGLMLKNDWILPADLAGDVKNPALAFVYLTSCDSGEQRDAWVSALAPADVVTYDRLSAVLEHAWWLWFRGPEKIRSLETEGYYGQ